MSLQTPVVFMVFNRPEPTRRVFETIRAARPAKLLVICDGPRASVPSDSDRVAEVRRIIAEGVDWPCEVQTDYAPENLGCRKRVATGLDWAFSLVEEAIILEDDCLADPSFFPYCETLLARYRDDPRVMHIGSNNFQRWWRRRTRASYYFSKYNHIWGWATWRRAWQKYDARLESWADPEVRERITASFDSDAEQEYWLSTFDRIAHSPETATTWDYQWTYTCWLHNGLSIVPARNLVTNIGIGNDGTHSGEYAGKMRIPARALHQLTHPEALERNIEADRHTFDFVYAYQDPNPFWRNLYRARIALGSFKKRGLASLFHQP